MNYWYEDTWEVSLLSGEVFTVTERWHPGVATFADALRSGVWFQPNGNEWIAPSMVTRIKRVRRITADGAEIPVDALTQTATGR